MRDILFRGKRPNNGDWVVGNLFVPDKDNAPTEICVGTNVIRITYEVIPETVGQYTGLYDKNGTKIFEGDIVEFESHGYYPKVDRGVVIFKKGCFGIEFMSELAKELGWDKQFHRIGSVDRWQDMGASGEITYTYEVIGNIHDNPELLKEGAE